MSSYLNTTHLLVYMPSLQPHSTFLLNTTIGLGVWPNFYARRTTIVNSAVLRLHVVRLCVRLSVTLVDQDHIGWKSWKLLHGQLAQRLHSS